MFPAISLRVLVLALFASSCTLDRVMAVDEATISFRAQVAPLLFERCLPCHGTKKAEGGYRVDTYDELLKAGDSGLVPIVAAMVDQSELVRRLTCEPSERMPADDEPLTEQQIAFVSQWIAAGAAFDGEEGQRAQQLVELVPPIEYLAAPEHYPATIPITAVCFSPDGTQLFAAGYHEVTVWNVADGQLVRRVGNVGERVYAIAVSNDHKTIAVGGGEPGKRGEVRLFDVASGEFRGMACRTNDVVLDLAFRPGESSQLAVAAADGQIRIVDVPSTSIPATHELHVISSHADWVTSVAWSADGTRLASASRDKSAKVYETEQWQLLSSYLGHAAPVRGIYITADNSQVMSVGADQKLHRWNLADAAKVAEIGLGGEGFGIIYHEGFVHVPCSDHQVRMIDLSNNSVARTHSGHSDWVLSAAVGSQQLAAGSLNGELRIWNLADGNLQRAWLAKP